MDCTKLKESEEYCRVGRRVIKQKTTRSIMYAPKSMITCLRTEPDHGQSTSCDCVDTNCVASRNGPRMPRVVPCDGAGCCDDPAFASLTTSGGPA
jgi:hypothetical protein